MRGLPLLVMGLVALPGAAGGDNLKPLPQPKSAPSVGVTEVFRFVPSTGFVDDPVATDGKRIALVVADTAGTAELHVFGLDGVEVGPPVDLAPITLKPTALAFIGDRVLVIGGDGDAKLAALVGLDGKVVYKTPPANQVTLVNRDGKPLVALYRNEPIKTGTRHSVEVRAAATGKKVGKVKTVDVDGAGKSAKLELRINHWTRGWTQVVGIKDGAWNKAEDQRSPDVEAVYDMVSGKFTSTAPIPDLLAQRKRFAILAAADGKDGFVRMKEDLSELELWQDGVKSVVTLDQPLMLYGDPRRSLDFAAGPDGPWIALQVDPVNVEAVKRQKADIEYWDLFEVKGDKATRKARLFAGGQRVRFGWAGGKLWVLDRNVGFDRGGKSLAFYTVP